MRFTHVNAGTAASAAVLLLYVVLYGWMLLATDLLPYVMDNNESFSSLWHAANIYNFGITQTYGLADESFSPHAMAHPYVHTHQGNFPRLFAFLIYVIGARTVESQILITTFTVGLAAVALVYAFFARIATPLFAAIVCAVYMTDYVLFAQWHVVTYRVWHCFLLFLCLYCTERAAEVRSGKWIFGLAAGFLGLFYFELVFAVFVGALCGLYAVFKYRTTPLLLTRIVIAQTAGAAVGIALVAAQGIAYLGLDDFRQDVYLTFLARNDVHNSSTLLEKAARFYESKKVVFWYNVQDREAFAGVMPFIRSLTSFDWRVHTPLLAIAIWILSAGWLLSLLPRRNGENRRSTSVWSIGPLLLAVVLSAMLPQSVLFDRKFSPISDELHQMAGPHAVELLVVVAASLISTMISLAGADPVFGLDHRRQLRGVLVFMVCSGLAYLTVFFLSPGYIYSGYLERHAPFTVFFNDVLVAVGLYAVASAAVILTKSALFTSHVSIVRQYARSSLAGVAVLLASFLVGYWFLVQARYVSWLPPDHYAFLKKLMHPPYRGASFVANNYAAPVAAYTGQWAYFDPAISQGFVVRKGQYLHLAGDRKYLWFADRDTNPEYREPDYFICMIAQTPMAVVNRLRRDRGSGLGEPGCSTLPLVRLAANPNSHLKGVKVVEYDRAGLEKWGTDSWAIVKLDWNDSPEGTVLDWSIQPFRTIGSPSE